MEVVRHLKSNIKGKEGEVSWTEIRNGETPKSKHTPKIGSRSPPRPKKIYLTLETLEQMKGQQRVMNNTRKGMGDNALKLINAYIVKKKLQAVDKNYK